MLEYLIMVYDLNSEKPILFKSKIYNESKIESPVELAKENVMEYCITNGIYVDSIIVYEKNEIIEL